MTGLSRRMPVKFGIAIRAFAQSEISQITSNYEIAPTGTKIT